MDYTEYVRVPFGVTACEVTEENFDEVFELIGKEIKETPAGKKYILIDRRIIPNGHKAQVGGWVTIMGDKIRYYSKTAFADQFTPKGDTDLLWKLEQMAYSLPIDADMEETPAEEVSMFEDDGSFDGYVKVDAPDIAGRDV